MKNLKIGLLFSMLMVLSTPVSKAEDGQLGTTSTAIVHISITIPPIVEILQGKNGMPEIQTNMIDYHEEINYTKDDTIIIILVPNT